MRELESQIFQSKAKLEVLKEEKGAVSSQKDSISRKITLRKEMFDYRPLAASSRAKYSYAEGLGRWKPIELNLSESSFLFHFLGLVPNACVSIKFDTSGRQQGIQCRLSIDPRLFRRRKNTPMKLSGRSTDYLEREVRRIVVTASGERIDDTSQIGPQLQKLDWILGRIESTAIELTKLEQQTMMNMFVENDKMFVTVELEENRRGRSLCGQFELTSSYPFAPLNVTIDVMEGDINVRSLQKRLIKNAKPGFGYLTRTCECIKTFLDSTS